MFFQCGLLARDDKHAVLLIADANFLHARFGARLWQKNAGNRGAHRQFEEVSTLHCILLTIAIVAIMRYQDDGATR